MNFRGLSFVLLTAAMAAVAGTAQAQLVTGEDGLIDKLNHFLPLDPSQPLTVSELCHRLDCLANELRRDGLIVVKQPDVFSQARMTRFRNDFENQMSTDLANFHLVLVCPDQPARRGDNDSDHRSGSSPCRLPEPRM